MWSGCLEGRTGRREKWGGPAGKVKTCAVPSVFHPDASPTLTCFLLSLPKTRKGSSRESPLSHPATAPSGYACRGQGGEPKARVAVSTPPTTACLASPLLFGKMAPQGQSVPCISQENASFLYYLMELRPKKHKRVAPCLSFLPPEGLTYPLSGHLAKL